MKKYILFLIVLFSGASLVQAAERNIQSSLDADMGAAQDRRSTVAAEAAPGWLESLAEVQRTASELIDANSRLTAEYRQLEASIRVAQEALVEQKDKNAEQAAVLEAREQELGKPVDRGAGRRELTELQSSAAQKEDQLKSLQARSHSLDNQMNLLKLKLAQLEVEKKSILLEQKVQPETSLSGLKKEIDALQANIESQVEQEKMIRAKIAALSPVADPDALQAQTLTVEIAELKQKLDEAAAREKILAGEIARIQDRVVSPSTEELVSRYKQLAAQKDDLDQRIADQAGQREALDKARSDGPLVLKDIKQKIAEMEEQNKMLVRETENLRENIALLEYKITSVQNYQDRNTTKGR